MVYGFFCFVFFILRYFLRIVRIEYCLSFSDFLVFRKWMELCGVVCIIISVDDMG